MKELIRSIYPFVCIFFVISLALDKYAPAAPNVLLILLIALFPFVITLEALKRVDKKIVIVFTGLIVTTLIVTVITHDITADLSILKKLGSSLLLFVLILPITEISKLKKAIVLSCFLAITVSLYHIYFFYINEGAFSFSNAGPINEVLIIDRLYLGFLCVLGIVSAISLMKKNYHPDNRYYFAFIVITIVFLLLISSRLAILILLLLFALKIFYVKKKKPFIFFFLGLAVVVFLAFQFNHNLGERFLYSYSTSKKGYVDLFLEKEPRVIIWSCALEQLKENDAIVAGVGFRKTVDKLVICYDETVTPDRRKNYFVEERFNTHNQFLDFLLSKGIISFLLFLGLFLALFVKYRRDYTPLAFTLVLFAFCNIENIFHRQFGAYIFAIVFFLILNHKKQLK